MSSWGQLISVGNKRKLSVRHIRTTQPGITHHPHRLQKRKSEHTAKETPA